MATEIVTVLDGVRCDSDLEDRIRKHVQALDSACGGLQLCRVRLGVHHKRQGCGDWIFAAVEARQARAGSPALASHAIDEDVEGALLAAFALARAQAKPYARSADASPRAARPGHIVRLTPDGAGLFEIDGGDQLPFSVSDQRTAPLVHVGDRAWLMPHQAGHACRTLVCASREGGRPVDILLAGADPSEPDAFRAPATKPGSCEDLPPTP